MFRLWALTPPAWALPSCCRTLLGDDEAVPAQVVLEIATFDARTTLELLAEADLNGILVALLKLLGGQLGSIKWKALSAQACPCTACVCAWGGLAGGGARHVT